MKMKKAPSGAFLALLIVLAAVAMANADENSDAKSILATTGVQGGLVVQLGCGDGKLTATLRANDRYLVHGLDADAAHVAQAREHIQSLGKYGPVSVQQFDGGLLPYADNLVNLLVAEELGDVPLSEVLRALAPHGVAYVKQKNGWTKTIKPWPEELDEWTHWLHSPDGNAVARDRVVGPPRRLQWAAKPQWARHHDTVPSTTAMVSARGRLFYISDEAPVSLEGDLPDKWFLVARDAFNGALLWKRPIAEWGWSQWGAEWRGRFNIPPQLPKRLVAAGDRVYVTLGFNAPLTALDAATGELLHTYKGTRGTDEILHRDGLLILSINQEVRAPAKDDRAPVAKSVCVIEAASGKTLWRKAAFDGLRAKYNSGEPFTRLELALGDKQIFLVDGEAIVSFDLKSGERRWRAPRPDFTEHLVMYDIRMSDQCVMLYQEGVVLFAQPEMLKKRSWHTLPGTLHAFRASDGKPLWKQQYGGWAHNWQPDVFVIDGLVWVHEHIPVDFPSHTIDDKSGVDYAVIGLDLQTGERKRRFSTKEAMDVGHHHRCYRGKATERFLLASRRGVEFLDLATEENSLNHWARGGCLHGFVPCNGLLYLNPHPCDCYIATKLSGYVALAPASGETRNSKFEIRNKDEQFVRGPAFGKIPNPPAMRSAAPIPNPQSPIVKGAAWPTFRGDASRSGASRTPLPVQLELAWRGAVGARLSPPVVAAGKVFLAAIDEHRVLALDAANGKAAWSFTAGGRVDTPPTIVGDLALFGSADGWVYCLRAADGRLVWRRRVAPEARLVGAFGQLESAWPVAGSVLVQGGVAYVAAGRSSYLDGGIQLCALEPQTGKIIEQKTLYSPDPQTGKMPPGDSKDLPGALADILVGDGVSVYMRQEKVLGEGGGDRPHLLSTGGFRDDAWFNRTRWTVGAVAGAQLLVFDEQTAYGVSAYPGSSRSAFFKPGGQGYQLFAARLQPSKAASNQAAAAKKKSSKYPKFAKRWETRVPVRATAMALAGEALVLAGAPDVVDPRDPLAAFEGRKGARLWLVSTADGKMLAEYQLENLPVHDGLAAAGEKLYLATAAGEVLCFSGKK